MDVGGKSNSPPAKLFRAGLLYVLTEPKAITIAVWKILTNQVEFVHKYVSDHSTPRLVASFRFYLGVFSLAFVLYWFSSQFQLYDGISEIRELVRLLLQVAIGIPVIYLLLLVTKHPIKFRGLLQIALYVDGAYILVSSVVSLPLVYFDFLTTIPSDTVAIDIFTTEYERCLAQNSLIYWVIRGNLQFLLYHDRWQPNDLYRWVIENLEYLIVIPFLFVFAEMIRIKYRGRIFLTTFIAAIAFVTAIQVTRIGENIVTHQIANASNCESIFLDEILKKYSVVLVTEQIAYKLSNQLKRHIILAVPKVGTASIICRIYT